MRVNDEPVVVEQTFNATVDTVWKAITEIDLMRQWYFENIPVFKAEVGFETQFNVTSEGRDFLHIWRVTEVVPLKKIAYTWKYDNYQGDAFVEFELFEQENSTKLRLTVNVLESFSEDVPEFTRESCIGGWEYFIGQRLKEYLEPSK
ncbi:MAG: SRPBCC domain-containing protein [candidate division Zixibacteria bacterium]|nr:SRPBCC domain-containing protein [candidate division Zixibacteria bacterium]MDH3936425.1 SRPBCC domain-containing protein [candidate division Zixibacteria bacterium]MDH4035157.1 SRPBCC domain-containing protein [candidate division Zixibacteria bacterium]